MSGRHCRDRQVMLRLRGIGGGRFGELQFLARRIVLLVSINLRLAGSFDKCNKINALGMTMLLLRSFR